jgi:uncharacterized protein (DUF1330 family)
MPITTNSINLKMSVQTTHGVIMKNIIQLTLKTAGAVLLAGAAQSAMAQSKPAYLISELNFKDYNAYMAEYSPKIREAYAKYGAEFIVGTPNVQVLDQKAPAPQRVVIAKFPNMERAQAFVSSSERLALIPIREKTTTHIKSYLVEGN